MHFNYTEMRRCLNTIKAITVAASIIIGSALAMHGQDYKSAPIEISKEKIRVDGKICYSHIVQERQTLFSISKAYGVSVEDIYAFNPTIKETGLKKNSILIIPSKDAVKTVSDTTSTVAKATETPLEASQEAEQPAEDSHKKAKRIHIAKWYEDLDVIAAQYGVTAEEIMKANNLKGKKLAKRQKLLIPYPGEYSSEIVQDPAVMAPAVQDEAVAVVDTTSLNTAPVQEKIPQKKVESTIILPLTNNEGEPNRNNLDFYCGALLAVYDLAEKGIDCNLNVYDIMDNKTQLSSETIKGSDVVIGPISAADLTRVFYAASGTNAVVSPLDPRSEKLLKDHPEMIQAPTPHAVQYTDLVKWIEEDYREGDKVVMITEKGTRHSNITGVMKEALDSSALNYSPFSYSILEGRDVTEPLTALMSTEGANRVLIASESEAFVNDVIRNLNLLIFNNLDIVLYTPSKVKGFETIEVENFHNTSMHVSLGYYIDYESDDVKNFLLKYRALYNTEPTQFAFQGYDLTKYFLGLSAKYGKDWKEHLTNSPAKMLQSTMQFVKHGSGGYTNNGVRRIIYDKGYTIKNVQ